MQDYKQTNLLKAVVNLINAGFPNLQRIYKSGNRINSAGDALEYYIKDMFANTFDLGSAEEKENAYRDYFSWFGNQNNPPDFIVAGGDAIEVKKTVGLANGIALNSSPPKDYLYSDDPRIVRACKECEDEIVSWKKKDLIYAVGSTNENKLISLWIVYGNCYAADREIYARVAKGLVKGISDIKDIEFGETKELARVNKVDPLGITDLRVRGMWGIKSPHRVFSYLTRNGAIPNQPDFHILILEDKYRHMEGILDETEIGILNSKCRIETKGIIDPNNPANKLRAIYLKGNLQNQL